MAEEPSVEEKAESVDLGKLYQELEQAYFVAFPELRAQAQKKCQEFWRDSRSDLSKVKDKIALLQRRKKASKSIDKGKLYEELQEGYFKAYPLKARSAMQRLALGFWKQHKHETLTQLSQNVRGEVRRLADIREQNFPVSSIKPKRQSSLMGFFSEEPMRPAPSERSRSVEEEAGAFELREILPPDTQEISTRGDEETPVTQVDLTGGEIEVEEPEPEVIKLAKRAAADAAERQRKDKLANKHPAPCQEKVQEQLGNIY